jgi:hypothetical protein
MKSVICTRCGHQGNPTSETPGSFILEVFLWLMFIVPGVIYSLWRLSKRRKVCRSCGSPELVPLDSPRGKQLSKSVFASDQS